MHPHTRFDTKQRMQDNNGVALRERRSRAAIHPKWSGPIWARPRLWQRGAA